MSTKRNSIQKLWRRSKPEPTEEDAKEAAESPPLSDVENTSRGSATISDPERSISRNGSRCGPSPSPETSSSQLPEENISAWQCAFEQCRKDAPEKYSRLLRSCPNISVDSQDNGIFCGDPIALVMNLALEIRSVRKEQKLAELGRADTVDRAIYTLSVHAEALSTAHTFDTWAAFALAAAAVVLGLISNQPAKDTHALDHHASIVDKLLVYARYELDYQSNIQLRDAIAGLYLRMLEDMDSLYSAFSGPGRAIEQRGTQDSWLVNRAGLSLQVSKCRGLIEKLDHDSKAYWEAHEKTVAQNGIEQHDKLKASFQDLGAGLLVENVARLQGLELTAIPNRVTGTCKWLVEHPKFMQWRSRDRSSLLWLSLGPGCGKTVLCKYLLERDGFHLTAGNTGAVLCSYFFGQNMGDHSKPPHPIAALIHQLVLQMPELRRVMREYARKHGDKNLDSRSLWSLFLKMLDHVEGGGTKEIVCIIDGLDEIREDFDTMLLFGLICDHFLAAHTRFSQSGYKIPALLKMVITSRPSAKMHDIFTKLVQIERRQISGLTDRLIGQTCIFDTSEILLSGNEARELKSIEHDVKKAALSIVRQRTSHLGITSRRKMRIKNQLRPSSFTSYHNVHAAVEQLLSREKGSTKIFKHTHIAQPIASQVPAVAAIKSEDFSLNAYADTLERTLSCSNRARRLIHLVLAARKRLTTREAQFALAMDEHFVSYEQLKKSISRSTALDLQNIGDSHIEVKESKVYLSPQLMYFLEAAGKIEIEWSDNPGSSVFCWGKTFLMQQSHAELARVCLCLLSFSGDVCRFREYSKEMRADIIPDLSVAPRFQRERLLIADRYPLMAYALENVAHHLTQADGLLGKELCDRVSIILFSIKSPVQSLWTVYNWEDLRHNHARESHNALLFARLGLVEGLQLEKSGGVDLSASPDSDRHPMTEAAIGGDLTVAEFLLDEVYNEHADMLQEISKMRSSPLWNACYFSNAGFALRLMEHHPLWLHKYAHGLNPIFASLLARFPDRWVFEGLLQHNLNCTCQADFQISPSSQSVTGLSHENRLDFEVVDTPFLTLLLILGAAQGDLDIVRLLLRTPGIDVDGEVDEPRLRDVFKVAKIDTAWLRGGKSNALLWALKRDKKGITRALLSANADWRKCVRDGETSISSLGSPYHSDLRKMLNFDRGSDLVRTYEQSTSALRIATVTGDIDTIQVLLKRGVAASELDKSSLVHVAVRYRRVKILHYLLAKLADVNVRGDDGSTPIYAATFHQQKNSEDAIFKALLSKGADPNLEGGHLGYPLQVAAHHGDISRLTALIDAGAYVNAYGGAHSTALHAACSNLHLGAVKLLLHHGANPELPDTKGQNCLLVSLRARNLAAESTEPRKSSRVNTTSSALDGLVGELAEALRVAGSSFNVQDDEGETPLLVAVMGGGSGDRVLARQLLAADADVNYITKGNMKRPGMTALRQACINGDRQLVHLLYHHGAEPGLRLKNELSPLEEAVFRGHDDIAVDLLSFGADVNAPGIKGTAMLRRAIQDGNVHATRFLLQEGASWKISEPSKEKIYTPVPVSSPIMDLVAELRPELAQSLTVTGRDEGIEQSRTSS